jgi:hypothetical protein
VNCFDVVSAYVLKMNWHFFKQETEISRIIWLEYGNYI